MTRPLRIEYPYAWYHVMNRGRRKEPIFFEEKDYYLFLKILKQTVNEFGIEIHAYALMPNHYHMLINTPKGNISRAMRYLNGVYTQAINKKYGMDGQLFRGRYKSIIVSEDEYLLELVRYIHRNPYRAKLEKEIGEYKWSSHGAYYKRKRKKGEFIEINYILRKFGEREKEARREFEAFVKKEESRDLIKRLGSVNWPSVLGGEKFKDKIKSLIEGKKLDMKEVAEYRRDLCNKVKENKKEFSIIKKRVEKILKKEESRKVRLERRVFIYLLRKEYDVPFNRIGELMGGVSSVAISKQYKRGEEEIRKKKGIYEEIKGVKKEIRFMVKI